MSGHLVFVRFFPGYSESFRFDRFACLKDEDIGGMAETLRQEPANRDRFERWRIETSQRRIESDYLLGRRKLPPLPAGGSLRCLSVVITEPPWDQTQVPTFHTLATAAGWRRPTSDDFLPYCISSRYPVARFDFKEHAEDAASALQRRVSELAKGALTTDIRVRLAELLSTANPRFSVAGERELSRPELAIARERIQRLSSPVSGTPTLEERYLREYWPLIHPVLEQIVMMPPEMPTEFKALRSLAGSLKLKGNEETAVVAICEGRGRVPIADLAVQFGWGNPTDNWNSTRKRLNTKFKGHGWRFSTEDKYAVAEQIPKPRK